jgi:hypothetical protein
MDPVGQGRPLLAARPLQPLRAGPRESEGWMWSWAIKREPVVSFSLPLSPERTQKSKAAAVKQGREAEKRHRHRHCGQ